MISFNDTLTNDIVSFEQLGPVYFTVPICFVSGRRRSWAGCACLRCPHMPQSTFSYGVVHLYFSIVWALQTEIDPIKYTVSLDPDHMRIRKSDQGLHCSLLER